ncbi:MAG: FAD-binding protein [Desulfovibrionaceae bacterium]|nr:FAD-binding protein [Desulfovibrionaceae bacterium]
MENREHIERLKKLLPEGAVLDAPEDVRGYGYDAQAVEGLPFAVCLPASTAEVSAVLKYCFSFGIPVTPRGAGSGMTGGSVPLYGGVVLSMQRMNAIESIDEENFVATVQPGVITTALHKAVEAKGLFYPPDPASMAFSTIGGNIAENSGGMRAVKYGVTASHVMGLEVVLPDGSVVHTGSKCIKDVVGINLTPVFVGSEGLLGVVTRAWLRLIPLPPCKKTARIAFKSMIDAGQAVTDVMHAGVVPLTLEFMDKVAIGSVENQLHLGLPLEAGGMLIIEVDGDQEQTERDMARVLEVCRRFPLLEAHIAANAEEQADLWRARRGVAPSLLTLKPRKFNEDIVVPRARIPQMLEKIADIGRRHGLIIANYGHAGDGNIHVNILSGNDEAELEQAHQAIGEVFAAATELEGRISGEHGIGLTKKDYIELNVDETTLAFMRKLKAMLDPKGLLNPGKVFPEGR